MEKHFKKTTKPNNLFNKTPTERINIFLTLAKKAGLDGFLVGIILMVLISFLWPGPGVKEGMLSIKGIANLGVALIFFFYGLRLSPIKFKTGIGNWRLHLVIHSATFLLFPIIVLLLKPFFHDKAYDVLWVGTFFLAALPSTVSSSVVMVSIAGGNLPSAIFNASISSLAGVFITPLWMGLVLSASDFEFDFLLAVAKLIVQVLVPVISGILLVSYLGNFAEIHKKRLKYFDQAVILLIVYTSFSESFEQKMFQSIGILELFILGMLMIIFFFLVFLIIHVFTRILNFDRADRITALFCGSKKSLVQGTVMAKVLFPASSLLGIILLPIMIYHAFQLIAASIIAQSMARNEKFNTANEVH